MLDPLEVHCLGKPLVFTAYTHLVCFAKVAIVWNIQLIRHIVSA
jgi:energy-converting hydrogenase Eha subunit E